MYQTNRFQFCFNIPIWNKKAGWPSCRRVTGFRLDNLSVCQPLYLWSMVVICEKIGELYLILWMLRIYSMHWYLFPTVLNFTQFRDIHVHTFISSVSITYFLFLEYLIDWGIILVFENTIQLFCSSILNVIITFSVAQVSYI